MIKLACDFFVKLASVRTFTFDKSDPSLDKYTNQIQDILTKRYIEQLGYQAPSISIQDLPFGKLIVTVDDESDKVISISGIDDRYGRNRVRMFATVEPQGLANLKKNQAAMFSQISETFAHPNTFSEISEDIFKKLIRFYNLYTKINGQPPFTLYYFPATQAAALIPKRKILVGPDGVMYGKRVIGANTFATKVVIGNSELIKGQKGYSSYEEASQNATNKGKLISAGYDGNIRVYDFNPEFWGG